jgi:hypothetical protein
MPLRISTRKCPLLEPVQVEVFGVDRHEFCIGSGEDAVEEALGCGNVGGGSTSPGYWMRLPPTVDRTD